MRVGRLFFIWLLISANLFDHLRFSKVVSGLRNELITPLGSRNLWREHPTRFRGFSITFQCSLVMIAIKSINLKSLFSVY